MGIHDQHRERVRQRFLNSGLDAFADHEILELLLFYAIPRQDTNPVAHALIDRYGSLNDVLGASVEDLQQVKGIGQSAAILLHLVPELVQRARMGEMERELIMDTTERVGSYLLERFSGVREEEVYQLCLDRKGKFLACKCLGEGDGAMVVLDIRKLVNNALQTKASFVILAHNHPSGLALPSRSDCEATSRAKSALEAIGVILKDHIIVADNDYVSLLESTQGFQASGGRL